MVNDFPDRVLLVVVAFAAAGDEGVGDHLLQGLTILVALALVQQAVHVVAGEPLVGQNGINIDVVVLGGVVITSSNGDSHKGTENECTLHLVV